MSANRNVPDSMVSLLYVRNRLERDILKIMDLTKYRLNNIQYNNIQYSLFAAKQKRELQKKKKEGRNLHFLLLPSELRAVSYIKNSDGVVFTKLKWTRTVCIDTTERG